VGAAGGWAAVADRVDLREVFEKRVRAIDAEPRLRAHKRSLRAVVDEKLVTASVGSKRQ
jgi:hypothetical protein